jgi:hypothetical protein
MCFSLINFISGYFRTSRTQIVRRSKVDGRRDYGLRALARLFGLFAAVKIKMAICNSIVQPAHLLGQQGVKQTGKIKPAPGGFNTEVRGFVDKWEDPCKILQQWYAEQPAVCESDLCQSGLTSAQRRLNEQMPSSDL